MSHSVVDLFVTFCVEYMTGIATRLVDPNGGRQHVGAKTDQQLLLTSWELPTDGWNKNLDSLPQFSYDHLFAHLVSNSKTVAANQKSSAKKTYKTTGAMKHKEAGYRLFQDDHVKRIKFNPGNIDQNVCFFSALVQASFKTSVHRSTLICLYRSNGAVCGAHCKCKARGGGCCKRVAALLYCVLDYSERQLQVIPDHKTCTDKPQQWNIAKNSTDGPILFSDILIVHHVYGKRKAKNIPDPVNVRNTMFVQHHFKLCQKVKSVLCAQALNPIQIILHFLKF